MTKGPLFVGFALFLTSVAYAQSLQRDRLDDRILREYHALRARPRTNPKISKSSEIRDELVKMESIETVPAGRLSELAAKFVALRAVGREVNAEWTLKPQTFELTIKKAYPLKVRQHWVPRARALWLLAFYCESDKQSKEFTEELRAVKRLGVNTDIFTIELIRPPLAQKTGTDEYIEQLFDFAETHPDDIAASLNAAGGVDFLTWEALYNKKPIPKAKLERIFALEARTVRNYNAFLNEHITAFRVWKRLHLWANGSTSLDPLAKP